MARQGIKERSSTGSGRARFGTVRPGVARSSKWKEGDKEVL